MTEFTPFSAAAGGLLIGAAAAVLLLGIDRVAGISGILGQALWPDAGEDRRWRLAFLAGLPLGAALVALVRGPLVTDVAAGTLTLVAGGLLVGFGTRLGNGCTSGHGVCGVSRGSPRSIAATGVFMGVALVTVFVVRHVLGAGS